MQWVDIYLRDEHMVKLDLFEIDLMEVNGSSWKERVEKRRNLIKAMFDMFFKEPVINRPDFAGSVFFLTIESRMHLVDISDDEMIEFEKLLTENKSEC